MANRKWCGLAAACKKELRVLLSFLPLLVGSIAIVLLMTSAGSASTQFLFQSPISPISPISTEAPSPTAPVVSQETPVSPTSTPSALRAVPTTPSLIPWIVGIVVVAVLVVVVLFWRGRRKGEEESL